jgi:hypothetical protein
MSEIKGEYIRHSTERGFVYKYTCQHCNKPFQDNAPEIVEPVLCHRCSIGGRKGRGYRGTDESRDKRRVIKKPFKRNSGEI